MVSFLKLCMCLLFCSLVLACANKPDVQTILPSRVDAIITGYSFEDNLPIAVEFTIKNSWDRPICVYQDLFESRETVRHDFKLRTSRGELLKKNPMGYVADLQPKTVLLKPGEVRSGLVSVRGWYQPLRFGRSVGLEANFSIVGRFCMQPGDSIYNPDFRIESGWVSVN